MSERLASGSGAIWEDCGTLRRWDLLRGSESLGGVGLEALQAGSTSCWFSAFWVQTQCGHSASRSCVCVFPACHHDFSTTLDCVPRNCEMKPTLYPMSLFYQPFSSRHQKKKLRPSNRRIAPQKDEGADGTGNLRPVSHSGVDGLYFQCTLCLLLVWVLRGNWFLFSDHQSKA